MSLLLGPPENRFTFIIASNKILLVALLIYGFGPGATSIQINKVQAHIPALKPFPAAAGDRGDNRLWNVLRMTKQTQKLQKP